MNDELNDIHTQINAYVNGVLSEDQINDLWVEFAKNPVLLDDLELEVGVKEIINTQIKAITKNKNETKTIPFWKWHAVAAAVLIIVISIQFIRIPSKSHLEHFLVKSINSDQLETANGVRSKEITIFKGDSTLNLGFNEYLNGNKENALALYNEIITMYNHEPYASKAYLNKGIFHYNNSNYDLAIVDFSASLERSPDDTMIKEKAFWFLANAYAHIDDLQNARNNAYEVYKMNGIFRKASFLLLQKLNYDLGASDTETYTD